MANPEHLKILREGVETWNKWRPTHWRTNPDLTDANLSRACLIGAKLGGVELTGANFRDTDLSNADLTCANLTCANLSMADLTGTNLSESELIGANLFGTKLVGANLFGVNLHAANLVGSELKRANLDGAMFSETMLANTDLSEAVGLESAKHQGPSSIGIDTLYKSEGRIPDVFLRDAGVPEEIIDLARSIRSGPPIQWHSCFISYSTKDEEFARRLHSRMRQANMRVWFAPEDLEGGKKLHEQVFSAIQLQDKLLLVLSPHSIQSEWVMTEIRKAREVENREKRRKLFPIRVMDFDALRAWTCFDADTGKDLAVEVREYFIPDFSNWKDHDAFEEAFKRLQKDLQAE